MIDGALARSIRLVVLDVDGVLTDGGVYLGAGDSGPFEFKRYDIQDGLGVYFLHMAGIAVAIITGRVSESVRIRAAELRVEHVVQDPAVRKVAALRSLTAELGIDMEQVAFVGDDIPDLGVMRLVGLPVSVANGAPEVHEVAVYRLTRSGGRGAVREFAESLLKARGVWSDLVDRYVRERSEESVDDAEPVELPR